MPETRARRRVDLVTAAVVVLLGVPFALLGMAGVVSAWREDEQLRLWQVALVVVVVVGVVRAVRQLQRPSAAGAREGG